MYIIDKDTKSLQCLEHVEVSLILHMLNWKCWDGTEVKLYSWKQNKETYFMWAVGIEYIEFEVICLEVTIDI